MSLSPRPIRRRDWGWSWPRQESVPRLESYWRKLPAGIAAWATMKAKVKPGPG